MYISLRFIFAVIAAAALVVTGSNTTNVSAPAPAPAPAANGTAGHADCPCKTAPATAQKKVTDKPDFVEGIMYGYGCKKHDHKDTWPQVPISATANNNDCQNLSLYGTADYDWCDDYWCIVDSNDCIYNTRAVTFTADPEDMFSYRTCEGSGFAGNGWVGRVACAHNADSFCSAAFNAALKGDTTCPCIETPVDQKKVAGKPDFVHGIQYGYWCRKHDHPPTYNAEPDSPTVPNDCVAATDASKAEGQASDWCNDKWCIVDAANCDFKTRAVTFTEQEDVFSYKTCDADFEGNGWVGREACTSNANSFCTAAENGGTTTSDAPAGTRLTLTVVLGICSAFLL